MSEKDWTGKIDMSLKIVMRAAVSIFLPLALALASAALANA